MSHRLLDLPGGLQGAAPRLRPAHVVPVCLPGSRAVALQLHLFLLASDVTVLAGLSVRFAHSMHHVRQAAEVAAGHVRERSFRAFLAAGGAAIVSSLDLDILSFSVRSA